MAKKEFTADDMRELLRELDVELERIGSAATIFVVGGSAMALAYNVDRATADIDGTFEPRDVVLDAAAIVARRRNLDRNWLSDGVRDFMPPEPDDHPRGERIGPALVDSSAPRNCFSNGSLTRYRCAVDIRRKVR